VRRLKDRKAAVEKEMRVASLFIDWLKKRGAKAPLEILLQTLGSMPEELTAGVALGCMEPE
jgi:hypothetical protein